MNTKLHAVPPFHGLHADHCRAVDAIGWPIQFFLNAGQVSNHIGARALVNSLPAADWLLGPSQRCYASPVGRGCPKVFLSAFVLTVTVIFWL
ncbi:hypothetical protein A9Q94_05270 [Rhodobacterales bacterium 56_14_T64]|nr:hypothetical protein A9Q94_05270 [Rhodobacterales bacterium 56_14_T64]